MRIAFGALPGPGSPQVKRRGGECIPTVIDNHKAHAYARRAPHRDAGPAKQLHRLNVAVSHAHDPLVEVETNGDHFRPQARCNFHDGLRYNKLQAWPGKAHRRLRVLHKARHSSGSQRAKQTFIAHVELSLSLSISYAPTRPDDRSVDLRHGPPLTHECQTQDAQKVTHPGRRRDRSSASILAT